MIEGPSTLHQKLRSHQKAVRLPRQCKRAALVIRAPRHRGLHRQLTERHHQKNLTKGRALYMDRLSRQSLTRIPSAALQPQSYRLRPPRYRPAQTPKNIRASSQAYLLVLPPFSVDCLIPDFLYQWT